MNKTIFDVDMFGGVNSNGAIKELWGKEALSNAFHIWISSMQGDILREPTRGGVLQIQLTKPVNEDTAEDIEAILRNGITQDFEPYLDIVVITVTPDYVTRGWKLYAEFYSPDFNEQIVIDEIIRSRYYSY